jgi:hypothetical protein
MDAELTVRLLVAAFCVVAPSVLFVGLVRALDRLRDDYLVDRALARLEDADETPTPAPAPTGFARRARSDGGRRVEPTVACGACGAENPTYASYCGLCLSKVNGTR